VRILVIFQHLCLATSLESSYRDLNDMAENRPILKNNQNTYHPQFGFTSKTGMAFPKTDLWLNCDERRTQVLLAWFKSRFILRWLVFIVLRFCALRNFASKLFNSNTFSFFRSSFHGVAANLALPHTPTPLSPPTDLATFQRIYHPCSFYHPVLFGTLKVG